MALSCLMWRKMHKKSHFFPFSLGKGGNKVVFFPKTGYNKGQVK